jgi:hypothetical protein
MFEVEIILENGWKNNIMKLFIQFIKNDIKTIDNIGNNLFV